MNTQGNESAKRTLVRLSQKLKGVEKGTPLSVKGQVNLLIQQAKDPTNLCRMYHGWKPHAWINNSLTLIDSIQLINAYLFCHHQPCDIITRSANQFNVQVDRRRTEKLREFFKGIS